MDFVKKEIISLLVGLFSILVGGYVLYAIEQKDKVFEDVVHRIDVIDESKVSKVDFKDKCFETREYIKIKDKAIHDRLTRHETNQLEQYKQIDKKLDILLQYNLNSH